MKQKRVHILSILLAVLLLVLPGCAREMPEETEAPIRKVEFEYPDQITLRLLMEEGASEAFRSQVQALITDFTAMYENVTIEIEELTDPWGKLAAHRDHEIEVLQNQMSKGEGPDIFLFSAASSQAPLFPDLNKAMREGYFADLNAYYMADADLEREGLAQTVMEAGTVGDARYLLPLSYDSRVLYVDMEQLADTGLTADAPNAGITGLLEAVNALGDAQIANNIRRFEASVYLLDYFPAMLDYDAKAVRLEKDALVAFLQACQDFHAAFPEPEFDPTDAEIVKLYETMYPHSASASAYCQGKYWAMDGFCMDLTHLSHCIPETVLAKVEDVDLKMFPMTGPEGIRAARVGYYGAVSSHCDYPDVAYEFLRRFLLEQTQWEKNVDISDANMTWSLKMSFLESSTLGSNPVRVLDSVPARYQQFRERTAELIAGLGEEEHDDGGFWKEDDGFQQRSKTIMNVDNITETDIPLLWEEFDTAYLTVDELRSELNAIITSLNDPETGEPANVDIEALAQGYIDFLNVYLHQPMVTE